MEMKMNDNKKKKTRSVSSVAITIFVIRIHSLLTHSLEKMAVKGCELLADGRVIFVSETADGRDIGQEFCELKSEQVAAFSDLVWRATCGRVAMSSVDFPHAAALNCVLAVKAHLSGASNAVTAETQELAHRVACLFAKMPCAKSCYKTACEHKPDAPFCREFTLLTAARRAVSHVLKSAAPLTTPPSRASTTVGASAAAAATTASPATASHKRKLDDIATAAQTPPQPLPQPLATEIGAAMFLEMPEGTVGRGVYLYPPTKDTCVGIACDGNGRLDAALWKFLQRVELALRGYPIAFFVEPEHRQLWLRISAFTFLAGIKITRNQSDSAEAFQEYCPRVAPFFVDSFGHPYVVAHAPAQHALENLPIKADDLFRDLSG